MKINEITNYLESLAPLYLQEDYDNSGFITGNKSWNVSNVLVLSLIHISEPTRLGIM